MIDRVRILSTILGLVSHGRSVRPDARARARLNRAQAPQPAAGSAPARHLSAGAGLAAAGRRAEGEAGWPVPLQEPDHRRHGAPLLDLRARAVHRRDTGQRPRVPGWPARDQSDRLAARAAGPREPDPQEGHPGHHRHLHHARPARRRVSGGSRHRQSEQPRCRVRLAERRLRAVHRGRDAARGCQDLQPDEGSGRARDWRHEQRRDLRVHGRLASAGPVQERHQHDRELHVDWLSSGAGRPADGAGRRSLSDPHPEEPDQADQDLPAGRFGGPRQPARQLVPRESADARRVQLRQHRRPTPRRCPARDTRSSTSGAMGRIPMRMGGRCFPTFFAGCGSDSRQSTVASRQSQSPFDEAQGDPEHVEGSTVSVGSSSLQSVTRIPANGVQVRACVIVSGPRDVDGRASAFPEGRSVPR